MADYATGCLCQRTISMGDKARVRGTLPANTSNSEGQQESQQLGEALSVGAAGGQFVDFTRFRHCFYSS